MVSLPAGEAASESECHHDCERNQDESGNDRGPVRDLASRLCQGNGLLTGAIGVSDLSDQCIEVSFVCGFQFTVGLGFADGGNLG